jgi:ABC-type uncharacterized transport system substrate-binding protein
MFSRALNEAGCVNGQNVAIEFRWADGQLDRLPELAAELIERKVAVLFAGASDVAAGALRVAATTVPVVLATGSDPVAAGLVASLNRPGGNLTGVTVITAALWPKRLELLRELVSPTPLIGLLVNPNNLTATPARRELNAAARRIGQDVVVLDASTEGEFEAAFERWLTSAPARLWCQTTRCSRIDAQSLSRLLRAMPYPQSMGGASSPRPVAWSATAPARSINTTSRASMSVVYSRARSQPIYHSYSRLSSN